MVKFKLHILQKQISVKYIKLQKKLTSLVVVFGIGNLNNNNNKMTP